MPRTLSIRQKTKPTNRAGSVDWILLTIIFLKCIFALGGCAGPNAVEQTSPAILNDYQVTDSPQEELPEIVLPQREAEEGMAPKLYTLQVREAAIQELLLAFSEQTELSIIVDPKISGKVTVDLKGVTLEQALDAILIPIGLEYKREGNFIKVFQPKMKTRIFNLDYITTVRTGRGLVSGAIGGRDTGAGQRQHESAQQSASGGYSEVTSNGATDFWAEIETGLQHVKSTDGKIIVNRVSNSVLVKDYPHYIKRIAEFLATIEGSVQRQVMIQASIVEVSLAEDYEAGIDWGFIQSLPQMSNLAWGLASRDGRTGFPGATGTDSGGGAEGGETIEIPGHINVRPFSGVFRIGLPGQTIFLSDIVEALSTQGNVKILSNPRIATLNNQPAIIKVAREEVFFETTRTLFEQERTTESTARYVTIGIVLGVTPQIGSDGIITMSIHPSITEKVGEKISTVGDTAPIIDVRETDTVVRVRDQETILIAGLMQDKVIESLVGLPIMQDIPLLGRFFKHLRRETKKTELVIMLTPRILPGAMAGEISSAEMEKFERLRDTFFKD